jgi:predicted GNAT family acetyltransferase
MSFVIAHDHAARRFETRVDGMQCTLDYTLAVAVMTITHTAVPAAVGGRGIASALTQAAVDVARAAHWRIVPQCSYAAAWLRRHPPAGDVRQ